jgi:hypothetical protein
MRSFPAGHWCDLLLAGCRLRVSSAAGRSGRRGGRSVAAWLDGRSRDGHPDHGPPEGDPRLGLDSRLERGPGSGPRSSSCGGSHRLGGRVPRVSPPLRQGRGSVSHMTGIGEAKQPRWRRSTRVAVAQLLNPKQLEGRHRPRRRLLRRGVPATSVTIWVRSQRQPSRPLPPSPRRRPSRPTLEGIPDDASGLRLPRSTRGPRWACWC